MVICFCTTSYTQDPTPFATPNWRDNEPLFLHARMYSILNLLPFQSNPFYIFCESYGGKMNAAFAVALQKVLSMGQQCAVIAQHLKDAPLFLFPFRP